jgi:hypothetical protein
MTEHQKISAMKVIDQLEESKRGLFIVEQLVILTKVI